MINEVLWLILYIFSFGLHFFFGKMLYDPAERLWINVIAINCKIIWRRKELRNWLDNIFVIDVKKAFDLRQLTGKAFIFFRTLLSQLRYIPVSCFNSFASWVWYILSFSRLNVSPRLMFENCIFFRSTSLSYYDI